MITIDIVLDKTGIFRSCSASGHAGAGKTGSDIVCAAVTVLLRSFARVVSGRKGISIQSSAPKPGSLQLEMDYSAEGKDFLSAAGEYLITGLESVAEEYPGNLKLNINERRL